MRTVAFVLASLIAAPCVAGTFGASLGGPELRVGSLDINQDGKVDSGDHKVLLGIAEAARKLLEPGLSPIAVPLYQGLNSQGRAEVLAKVNQDGDKWDLTQYGPEDLRRLAVETRWLASQVQLVLSFKVQPKKETPLAGLLNGSFPGYSESVMAPKAVCEAVQLLDTKTLKANSFPLTAVFDLDNTVWNGHGIDYFLAALVESALVKAEAQGAMVDALAKLPDLEVEALKENTHQENAQLVLKRTTDASLPKEQRLNRKDGFYLVSAMLKGMAPKEAYRVAEIAMTQGSKLFGPLEAKFYDDPSGCSMRRMIGQLRSSGFQIYLISAGIDVLVKVAGDLLGIAPEYRLGSILEVKDDRYTGQVESTYMLKGPIVREWLEAPAYLAFGDSATSDIPFMLDAAGPAFMINPGDRFKKKDADKAKGRLVEVEYKAVEGDKP